MDSVAVLNPIAFIERDGRFYMNPDETNALRCWTDHFGRVLLLKPQLHTDVIPDGWLPLPGDVSAEPLYDIAPGRMPDLLSRIRKTRDAARRCRDRIGLLYLRAPSYEAYVIQEIFQSAGVPVLLELFGDFRTTILTEWQEHPIKRLLRHPVALWAHLRTRQMARRAEVVCCMGEALRLEYAPEREAFVTTAHLVPERAFVRRADTCQDDPVKLLFVGVLSPRKGVAHLVRAVKELTGQAHDVHLDLVGDGPSQASLEARVAAEGLGDRVTFHGRISHGERLLGFFRRADIMVLPSVGAEGLPRVIQEAFAASCPVVATDIGSVRYQLGMGKHGIVVAPGDSGALAEAIVRIKTDPSFRRSLIESGFAEAQQYAYERQWTRIGEFLHEKIDARLLRPATCPTLTL